MILTTQVIVLAEVRSSSLRRTRPAPTTREAMSSESTKSAAAVAAEGPAPPAAAASLFLPFWVPLL